MKRLLIAVAALGAAACSPGAGALYDSPTSLAVRMAQSEIARNPSPVNLDGIPAGKIKWNYTTGLELLAITDAGEAWDRPDFVAYADRYFDTIVRPGGEILTYRRTKYNLDHICPGRALFGLYARTGEPRYRQALDTLYAQLREQPRNFDGGFWHKEVYPHQMWLDGLYMAEPFYAQYAMQNLTGWCSTRRSPTSSTSSSPSAATRGTPPRSSTATPTTIRARCSGATRSAVSRHTPGAVRWGGMPWPSSRRCSIWARPMRPAR